MSNILCQIWSLPFHSHTNILHVVTEYCSMCVVNDSVSCYVQQNSLVKHPLSVIQVSSLSAAFLLVILTRIIKKTRGRYIFVPSFDCFFQHNCIQLWLVLLYDIIAVKYTCLRFVELYCKPLAIETLIILQVSETLNIPCCVDGAIAN